MLNSYKMQTWFLKAYSPSLSKIIEIKVKIAECFYRLIKLFEKWLFEYLIVQE